MIPLKVSESAITKQIRDYLKAKRIVHWKNFSTLGSVPGIPDILGCRKVRCECGREYGVMLAVEVKKPNGRLSEQQRLFLETLVKEGALAFKASSIDDLIEHGL